VQRTTLGPGALLATLVLSTAACAHDPAGSPQAAPSASVSASPSASPSGRAMPANYNPTDADFIAIHALLARRAAAINEGKRHAFLATVDPEADEDFEGLQKSYFANLRDLGATRVGYSVEDVGILPTRIKDNHDPVVAPIVTEHFLIPRTDDRPIGEEAPYTFVRRDGRWFLGAERPADTEAAISGGTERFWSGSPIVVASNGGVLVVVDEELGYRAEGLADAVSADLSSVESLLHRESDGRVLVDATSTGAATTMDPTDDSEAAAVTYSVGDYNPDDGPWKRAGTRIKVNPGDVKRLLDDRQLLRHELTHFVFRDYSGLVPKWLSEGLAEYAAWDGVGLERMQIDDKFYDKLMAGPHEVPISSLFGLDASRDYVIAHGAVAMLMQTYGRDRLFELMDAYADTDAEPWGDSLTRRLLKQVYDIRPRTFAAMTFDELSQFHH
jgi:hypothetical protein